MNKIFLMAALTLGFAVSATSALAGHHGDCDGHKCKMMKKIDANQDGIISKAEFMSRHEAHFKKMDADGNGELTAEEFKAAQSKMKAHKAKKLREKAITEKPTAE